MSVHVKSPESFNRFLYPLRVTVGTDTLFMYRYRRVYALFFIWKLKIFNFTCVIRTTIIT